MITSVYIFKRKGGNMCGIAGFYAPNKENLSVIKGMSDVIHHRGPDDFGAVYLCDAEKSLKTYKLDTEEKTYLALGHRRLSVVDLSSKGHQPMSYKNGCYWITYNGEIYNYIELRTELEDLGHVFFSDSDTEVVLAAYDEWGIVCQNRFNGMWAFVIYDLKNNSLFFSRDRFGIKPLYYWVSPDGVLYFGSEIKQFTQARGWQANLNHQRAYDFLVWGVTDHTEETLFKGVYQVRPGHHVQLVLENTFFESGKKISSQCWYVLKGTNNKDVFESACQKLQHLLKEAVNLRLRADVAVGSCLSGGLDSSSIVCLMNDILKENCSINIQKTFSACSHVDKYDEKKWIDMVVDQTDVEPLYVYPRMNDLFKHLSDITWHQDEPFGSTSIFAQWEVFSLAKENDVTVMLDGQGADEQLAGYHSFFGARLFDLIKSAHFFTFFKEAREIHRQHDHSWYWLIAHVLANILPVSIKSMLRKMVGRSHPNPEWLNLAAVKDFSGNPLDKSIQGVNKLSYAQMTSTNLQMLLHWEDRDSMAHSIESRVPFLDYRVVEYVMGLPSYYKIKGSITKRVLREAMDGIIPNKIKNRIDKIGFATPEEVWIKQQSTELFREKIKESIKNSNGIINSEALLYFDDVVKGVKPFNFTIWRIISFVEWLRVFKVNSDVVVNG